MSRFSDWVAEVEAAYPTTGTTTWLVGQEHESEHRNWNRIVAWVEGARVLPPGEGARAREGTVICRRVLVVHLCMWAATFDAAESRVHALHVALDAVSGESNMTIGGVREVWTPIQGDVTTAGYRVDVVLDLAMHVLDTDFDVVESGAEPGAGADLVTPTSITITPSLDSTELAPVVLTPEP